MEVVCNRTFWCSSLNVSMQVLYGYIESFLTTNALHASSPSYIVVQMLSSGARKLSYICAVCHISRKYFVEPSYAV